MIKALVNTANLVEQYGVTYIPTIGGSVHLVEQMTDVNFNGQRIAIINSVSGALQWTAKNGSNIPLDVIEYVEKQTTDNLIS